MMTTRRLAEVISKLIENGSIDGLDALLVLKQLGFKDTEIFCICPNALAKYQRIKTLDDIRQQRSEDEWLKDLVARNANSDLIRPSDLDTWLKEQDQIHNQCSEDTGTDDFIVEH